MISQKIYPILLTIFLVSISPLTIQGAYAADAKGQFSIRGAGLLTCSIYEQQREEKSDIYLITAAWVDGYLSATNQHLLDTYDILSFESTELLAAILSEHCKKHSNDRIFPVLKSMIEQLYADRLRGRSEKKEVVVGERKTSIYVEVLKRIQEKLAAAGYYKGEIDGIYGQSSIDAMKEFQRSIDFNPTGFPDQTTLWRLLRMPN